MTVKLKTPSNGSVSLTPQDTAADVVVTVPSTAGSFVTANSSGNVGIGAAPSSLGRLQILAPANSTSLVLTDGTQSTLQINHDPTNLLTYRTLGNAAQRWVLDATERMRLEPTGNLLLGVSSSIDANTKGLQVVSGTSGIWAGWIQTVNQGFVFQSSSTSSLPLYFLYNGTNVGYINTSSTTTAYVTSSDYRLKENIQPMQNALATVAQLNPVTYTWKADGSDGQGFIAHELQAVVPDAVTGEKDAVDADGKPIYQGVDTSFLVATLTAAIQEQQAIINSLQDRITALENA